MFQFTCGNFLIIGVLIESRIALAGEQQLADAPAFTKHGTSMHSRLEITFAYLIFKAERWLFWKQKGF